MTRPMDTKLTPEEIKKCEDGMEAMGFEKVPSSDTPKPSVELPSDAEIRKAVEADIHQFLTDSLTPDRGYDIPIDNVKRLIQQSEQP